MQEIERIKKFDEEEELAELWTAESLCFRYFNFFQQFKNEMATEIEWLQHCSRGSSLDEAKLKQIEQMKGIVGKI